MPVSDKSRVALRPSMSRITNSIRQAVAIYYGNVPVRCEFLLLPGARGRSGPTLCRAALGVFACLTTSEYYSLFCSHFITMSCKGVVGQRKSKPLAGYKACLADKYDDGLNPPTVRRVIVTACSDRPERSGIAQLGSQAEYTVFWMK